MKAFVILPKLDNLQQLQSTAYAHSLKITAIYCFVDWISELAWLDWIFRSKQCDLAKNKMDLCEDMLGKKLILTGLLHI